MEREFNGRKQCARSARSAGLQEGLLLFRCQRLPNPVTDRKHLDVWLNVRPKAMPPQHGTQGTEFKVDRLRGSSLAEPLLLVVSNVVGRDVDQEQRSDHGLEVLLDIDLFDAK
jgi:hypothetical protein